MRRSTIGDMVVYGLLIVVVLIMVLPFVHELAKSFSYPTEVDAGRVTLWPVRLTGGNYFYFYRKQLQPLTRSFVVTVYITVIGTLWSLLISSLMAFPISRPRSEFRLGPFAMGIVIFSMVFTPPIIPYFLAIKGYGLMDSLWAIIFPHSVVPFHLIILVTFFRELPSELFDSCKIDGAGSFRTFFRITLPLSGAALATVAVFTSIIMWNIFLHPLLFIQNPSKQPLQIFLRSIFAGGGDIQNSGLMRLDPFAEAESMRSALVILTTIPIVIVYPFLQRYFVKGVMIGAVKQ